MSNIAIPIYLNVSNVSNIKTSYIYVNNGSGYLPSVEFTKRPRRVKRKGVPE